MPSRTENTSRKLVESRLFTVLGSGITRKNKAEPIEQAAPELADSAGEILVDLQPDFVQRAAVPIEPQPE